MPPKLKRWRWSRPRPPSRSSVTTRSRASRRLPIRRRTGRRLAEQCDSRFSFVFTPKHGSWLNLVEGFFSKMARSVLRRIRVASKAELKQRILAYLDNINREPVVHTWSYKITLPA